MTRGSISAKDKRLHLLLRVRKESRPHTDYYSVRVGDLSSGVKRRETGDSPLSSATIKNEWTCTPYTSTARTGKNLHVHSQL